MREPKAGERLRIAEGPRFFVRLQGQNVDQIAIAAICKSGAVLPFSDEGGGKWQSPNVPTTETFEIVAYMKDDRQGGFVNQSYPVDFEVSGTAFRLPAPIAQLAAVILAEIYEKDGSPRMKVSNEGFAFGIEAYARTRNLKRSAIPFIRQYPSRSERSDRAGPGTDRPQPSSRALATGSGVFIAPNIIVTNAHVVEDGQAFSFGPAHHELLPVCVDPIHDLAVLQSAISGMPLPMRVGTPIWLGESVLASGYPLMDVLGSDLKVSMGNVSGLTGSAGDVARFQFTAPIGSGSSGGAVVDESGNLVGITSASLAHASMRERGAISENVNFAIRAALVFEMLGAAGIDSPAIALSRDEDRRDVVRRLRSAVVSISVRM